MDAKQKIDLAQIKASILEDVFSGNMQKSDSIVKKESKLDEPLPDLRGKLKSLYPDLKSFTLTQSVVNNLDSARFDTVTLFTAGFHKKINIGWRPTVPQYLRCLVE